MVLCLISMILFAICKIKNVSYDCMTLENPVTSTALNS